MGRYLIILLLAAIDCNAQPTKIEMNSLGFKYDSSRYDLLFSNGAYKLVPKAPKMAFIDTKEGRIIMPSVRATNLQNGSFMEYSVHDDNGNKIAYRKKDSLPVVLDWEKFFNALQKHPEHKASIDTLIGNFDLVPVTILVRISGRPWAFFHDGWEVRKVTIDSSRHIMITVPCENPGCAVFHGSRTEPLRTHSHLLYLDSRKRPIRKEWVVYQTFKR